jgi:hypothetical protein
MADKKKVKAAPKKAAKKTLKGRKLMMGGHAVQ